MIKMKKPSRDQSTRQLMGVTEVTEHGVRTPSGDLVYFLVKPDNLSVLSPEGIRARVAALTNLLRGQDGLHIMALDSRESFQSNKDWYRQRIEQEENPALRELLRQDMEELDAIQASTSSTREFVFALPLDQKNGEDIDSQVTRLEKSIQDAGFRVRAAQAQDVKRILACYYEQDVTAERFENFDGERAVTEDG